ncbi:MAG: branched-chain amino acid ABC transporter permease [Alphaproteobacteria bacterium]|nr:branched-chain amino acid ABC transporter permease [Alphaproteobacteria bacterium]MCB9929143.1 branched-chain amino acid ABC transporter permease [Alphaproteobacteria bacterium]
MRIDWFAPLAVLLVLGGALATRHVDSNFLFYAGYVVLQFVVLATAWNILGGFTGYVNFGSAAFFAVGAYTTIALNKWLGLPLLAILPVAALVAGLIGLAAGYLTLRLRGVFFSIATLALAVVLETMVANWDYVGGASGSYVIPPAEVPFFDNYIEGLFSLMLALAVAAVAIARYIARSKIGRGFAAIRDDEVAAECMGVPTLRLKLIATTLSGALMGIAGAPYPFYVTYVEPTSAFNLTYAVNAIAMPMVGGTTTWFGPVIGAVLLGSLQQWATVTISSELNLLIVGVTLVGFVVLAPQGLVGLARQALARVRRRP